MSPNRPNPFVEFLRLYRDDPVLFVREVLGVEPDGFQEDLLRAVAAGYQRISVRSGHGVGKSMVASGAMLWYLLARLPVKVTPKSATSFVDPKTGKAMLDTDRGLTDDARNLMQGGANLVGYAQVQNAGAWSAPINAAKQRNKGRLLFTTGRALTPSEMAKAAAAGKRVKMPDVVDYGERVLFNRFWSGRTKSAANAKNRKEATPKLRAVMDELGSQNSGSGRLRSRGLPESMGEG